MLDLLANDHKLQRGRTRIVIIGTNIFFFLIYLFLTVLFNLSFFQLNTARQRKMHFWFWCICCRFHQVSI